LCLSNFVSVFVSEHAHLFRDRRRHARLRLNLNLNLNLNLALYPVPNLALFGKSLEKTFERSNPLSFRSSLVLRNRSLLVLACLQPRRQSLPPRQSVGRPLHGRIVVSAVPDHHIWIRQ
jgi:hypothetical protein